MSTYPWYNFEKTFSLFFFSSNKNLPWTKLRNTSHFVKLRSCKIISHNLFQIFLLLTFSTLKILHEQLYIFSTQSTFIHASMSSHLQRCSTNIIYIYILNTVCVFESGFSPTWRHVVVGGTRGVCREAEDARGTGGGRTCRAFLARYYAVGSKQRNKSIR